MAEFDIVRLKALDAVLKLEPTVITYSRLEPMSLTRGDLEPGLQALLGDPLWLLGRQWQFEELRGEDGGSPIEVDIQAEHAPVTRFHPGHMPDDPTVDPATTSVAVPGNELPVEVAVEAELPAVLPERLRAQMGLHLLRLLRNAGLSAGILSDVTDTMITEWDFAGSPLVSKEPLGAERRRMLTGRVPDGARAAADLAARRTATGTVTSMPASINTAAGAAKTEVRGVLTSWLAWADTYLALPIGESWDPKRQEYAFALQATLSTGDVVLRADEYASGTVDWYTFDVASSPSLGPADPPIPPTSVTETVMPTPVRYPGMPSDRLWAFEDAKVYLGGLDAGPTDLARLALVEFAMVFGNDWFLAPFDLPYGSVARVHSLRVRDTFGFEVAVPPSRDVGRPGWTVFQNTPIEQSSPLDDVFFLPATVRHALNSPPLEEVALFRDEMANLVWGVERVVQGEISGEPVQRGRLRSTESLRQSLPGDLEDAQIVYRLMTPVPEHWIPFVSVPVPGRSAASFATELERRPMVRFLPDGTVRVTHPHGTMLRVDPTAPVETDRLRIAEEEVPRDGVVLTRTFQLARTEKGDTVLWIGRQKKVGLGEGSAGLKYDTALPPGEL